MLCEFERKLPAFVSRLRKLAVKAVKNGLREKFRWVVRRREEIAQDIVANKIADTNNPSKAILFANASAFFEDRNHPLDFPIADTVAG